MKNIHSYIIEKLIISKDIKISSKLESNKFLYVTYNKNYDIIRHILWEEIECFDTPENKNKEVIYIIYKEDKKEILNELNSENIGSGNISFHRIPEKYIYINDFIEDYINNKTNIVGTKV